jgi:hypothetical protein
VKDFLFGYTSSREAEVTREECSLTNFRGGGGIVKEEVLLSMPGKVFAI